MKPEPGQVAPDFTLFDTDKQKVSLSTYKGKNVVLLFFPFAFSGTCTAELCSVRDNYNWYTSLNAEVLGISTDSVFSLKKYKEDQQYNFKLLSDFNKVVSEAYGSLYSNFIFETIGVSRRSAFVIDKDGLVRYSEVLENASEQPDFDKIKATLQHI
ncbi:MAG: redoxin domain-containing protein [Bacteroidia bacterium]